jgi:hypothetical protein
LNRKLLILDVALLAVVVYAGFQLRNQWRAARAREAARLNRPVRQLPPPPFAPLPSEPAVLAPSYVDIAQKTLFDKSRDATVVVELPPEPPKPPMPALPLYHGMMNLGAGPTAILSVSKESPHKAVHPGETIGQFKLVDVNSREMTLEWEGQTVRKALDEFGGRNVAAAEVPEAARTETAPAAPAAPAQPVKSGPGEATQFPFRMCNINDGQPEGAVMEGYKKVVHATPFGKSCTWEPAGR